MNFEFQIKNKAVLPLLFLLLFSAIVNAATITSTATGGNWSAATTWTAVSRTGSITTTTISKSVVGSGTLFTTELAVGSVLKTTSGVTIGTVATITNNTNLTLVANAASANAASAYTAQVVPLSTDDAVIATTGVSVVTLTAAATAANVLINTGGTLSIGAINALTINGTLTNNGTFSGTSGQIILSGNFTNSGSFTMTTGLLSITSGSFVNSGSYTMSTGQLTLTTGNFTNTGTFKFTGAGKLALAGNYSNTVISSFATAAVQFTGIASQSIQAFTTGGTVSMLKTGGTATFVGNVNGAGLTINGTGGTLNLGIGLTHTFTGIVTLTAGTLNGGSSTLNENATSVSAWNGTGSVFVAGTGTVNFGGAGQTISSTATTFNNLTLSSSGVKKLTTINCTVNGILSMGGTATVSAAPTYGAAATLQYNTPTLRTVGAEWISTFAATGGVIIANTGIITLNGAKIFNASVPLTINSGAKLTTANFGLTFGGNFINNGGTFTAGSSPIVITSTMATQSIAGFTSTGQVSMTKTAGTATFTSNVGGAALTINGAGGTLNLGTALTHTFTGIVTLTAGTLNGGSSILNENATSATAWNGTGSVFVAGTGTVNFGGAAQTISATLTTFNNLTFSTSGIKTLTVVPTVNGILSMQGTATVSAAPTYGSAATLQYNTTTARTSGLEWITPFVASGGVIIANTGTITLNGAKVFNASVSLTINSGATLANGGFAISGGLTLSVANTGTLNLGATSAFPTFTTTILGATSTIIYSGAAQTVATQNYGNLSLSGTLNKTFAGATTIVKNFDISGSTVAILPSSTTSSSASLTFAGVLQVSGYWGSTVSGATNKDITHFGSSTTGVLNDNVTCIAGAWIGIYSTDWNTAGNWCGGIIPDASTNITIGVTTFQPVIGAASFCKSITINSGASLTITGSNTLTVSGNWINNGSFVANSSTVNFNGTVAQTIGGSTATVFYNLTNSNLASTLSAQLGITVNNILNISNGNSVLDMSTFALIGGGSFSNLGGGELMTSNNTSAPIPAGKTWTSVVLYNNLTGGQTIVGGTYSTLELDNTSGTQTASGNISTTGNLNLNNGGLPIVVMNGFNLSPNTLNIATVGAILDMSTGILNYTSVAAMEGTIRFSGASNGLPFPSGTVEYYGATQSVAGGIYYNLLFSGVSGSWSIGTDLMIDNLLTITNGAVDVQSLFTLNVGNAVSVTAPGTLTFENNASLLQTTYSGANTGNIIYNRTTTPMVYTDNTYWSSPVAGYTLGQVSPNTIASMFNSYDASVDNWKLESAATIMVPGKGYTIGGPQPVGTTPPSQSPFNASFIGVPNNGDITTPITSLDPIFGTSNLIGNPYPSAIDADAFLFANSGVIDGTLYFWTHNTGVDSSGLYNINDYASYNSSGGTAGAGTGATTGGVTPTGMISAGQGFFATGMVTGSVTFTNDMRVTGDLTGNNSQFFKTSNTKVKTTNAIEKDRIWLNLTNTQGAFKQTLVGYITGATNNYDNAFDGVSFDGNQFVDFYSVNQDKNLVIQGRALPFDPNDTVPLGFRSAIDGDFTINIDKVDGLLMNQGVFIEDKLTNTMFDLKSGNYTFTTQAGTFNDRLVLHYANKTLAAADFKAPTNKVLVSNKSKQIQVNSFAETINKVAIYDLLGRQIYQNTNVNSNELMIANLVSSHQALVVKTTLQNGETVNNKIVY